MKIVLLLSTICFVLSADYNYQSAKIDMHGGKDYSYEEGKSSSFQKMGMGMSAFLETNASKKAKQEKIKK